MGYYLGWLLILIPVAVILAGMIADHGVKGAAILLAVALTLAGMLAGGLFLVMP